MVIYLIKLNCNKLIKQRCSKLNSFRLVCKLSVRHMFITYAFKKYVSRLDVNSCLNFDMK